jgi:hypothetical protein
MVDAGEIIDLIDKEIIKDLQFCCYTFENTTAGKMMLGIAFVLSKQYSDKLSDDVKRGMRRSIEEGKWLNKAKDGYYKDVNKFLRPDGKNFNIIKSAWQMRLEGKSLEEVSNYVNSQGYKISTAVGGGKHKTYLMSVKHISKLFLDPFYSGVMQYGETVVNLTEIYDFMPMVDVASFCRLNKINHNRFYSRVRSSKGKITADLLRGCILCNSCKEYMTAGITHKKSSRGETHYFYFRCDTLSSIRFGRHRFSL